VTSWPLWPFTPATPNGLELPVIRPSSGFIIGAPGPLGPLPAEVWTIGEDTYLSLCVADKPTFFRGIVVEAGLISCTCIVAISAPRCSSVSFTVTLAAARLFFIKVESRCLFRERPESWEVIPGFSLWPPMVALLDCHRANVGRTVVGESSEELERVSRSVSQSTSDQGNQMPQGLQKNLLDQTMDSEAESSHQSTLQGGDWTTAGLLATLLDPSERTLFADNESEMACVPGYKRLTRKGSQSTTGCNDKDKKSGGEEFEDESEAAEPETGRGKQKRS
jgi:hypothetical protein